VKPSGSQQHAASVEAARHGQEQPDVGGAAVQRQVLRGKGASAPPMIPPTLNAIEIPV
jgi:hypothetical protein